MEAQRDGFRAEHAEVVALVKRRPRARARERRAAARYGVALIELHELEYVAAEHGAPLPAARVAHLAHLSALDLRHATRDGIAQMHARRPCCPLLALLLTVFLVGIAAGATVNAQGTSSMRCADVFIRLPDGTVYTRTRRLSQVRTTCNVARRVARGYLSGAEGNAGPAPRPLGYRCRSRGSGVACAKGTRRVTWSY